jgi:hypothetical protein
MGMKSNFLDMILTAAIVGTLLGTVAAAVISCWLWFWLSFIFWDFRQFSAFRGLFGIFCIPAIPIGVGAVVHNFLVAFRQEEEEQLERVAGRVWQQKDEVERLRAEAADLRYRLDTLPAGDVRRLETDTDGR